MLRLARWILTAFTSGLLVPPPCAFAQGIMSNYVGTDWLFTAEGRPAIDTPLAESKGLAIDFPGNLYISDERNHMVFRIDTGGILHVYAGNGIRGYSGDGGNARDASLNAPTGLAMDAEGNLYISDTGNHVIRKVTPRGIITTIAGNGRPGYSGDFGPAATAQLNTPIGIAIDRQGFIFFADSGNYRIRMITPDGRIELFAGNGRSEASGDNGPADQAGMSPDYGVAINRGGDVFFSEWRNNRVRVVDRRTRIIRTVAGTGAFGYANLNVPAPQSPLRRVGGLAFDPDGNLLIAEANGHRILRMRPLGELSVLAGRFQESGYAGDGGPAASALLTFPYAVLPDSRGGFYFTDDFCYCVRRVGPDGIIRTVGGNGLFGRVPDGTPAEQAFVSGPRGLAMDARGNLLIVNTGLSRVNGITPRGTFFHFAGKAEGCCRDGGPATEALLSGPRAIVVDQQNRVFISEFDFDQIRMVDANGTIHTIAGGRGAGFSGDQGPAINAQLNAPAGMVIDRAGNLIFADYGNRRIRRITPQGIISTIAGDGQDRFAGDGGHPLRASFRGPYALALTPAGELLVADLIDDRIRIIRQNGVIETIAGTGRSGSTGDGGPALQATLNGPSGITVDPEGNIYVLEVDGHRIRRIDPSGRISTVAGTGRPGYRGDGGPSTAAEINTPYLGILADAQGNVIFSDSGNDRVRIIRRRPPSLLVSQSELRITVRSGEISSPASLTVRSDVVGLVFQATVRTESGGAWLSVTPTSSAAPHNIQVGVDATNLAPGAYSGFVDVRGAGTSPAIISIPVRVTVLEAASPRLSLGTQSMTFSLQAGASAAASQTLLVRNAGGGALDFRATASTSSGGAWLSVSPDSGRSTLNSPADLRVTVSAEQLAPGTYSGAISIETAEETAQVKVALTVTERPRSILLLSQSGLSFRAVAGGGQPAPQTIGILNEGQGEMSWQARTITQSGGDWLRLNNASGKVEQPLLDVNFLEVAVDTRRLGPGTYYGRIEVTSASDNSPQNATVILTVFPAGSQLGPEVRPTGLVFTGIEGKTPGSQTLTVTNLVDRDRIFASSRLTLDGQLWLTHSPTNATVAPNRLTRVLVQPNFTDLPPGVRRGAITFQFDDGSIQTVSVLIAIASAQHAKADERGLVGCPDTALNVEFTSLRPDFVARVGEPTTVEVRVVDNCGNLLTPQTAPTAKVRVAFSINEPNIDLVHVGNGVWTGTWRPTTSSPGAVLMTVLAFLTNDPRHSGSRQLPGTIQSGSRTPLVMPGSLRHSATFETNVPVSPGQLISVLGANLAEREQQAEGLPLPKELAETEVLLAGRPLPLLYTSDGQLNAQLPYDLPVNIKQQLYVRRGSTISVPEQFVVAPAQPGIFTKNERGFGQGSIYRSDRLTLAEPGTPAAIGEEITIYCTGLGEVTPKVEAGQPAPDPPPQVVAKVEVTIGGVAAEVKSATLSAGTSGRYEVRVVVPEGAPTGDEVPVVVHAAGRPSPPVTMAIR